MIKTIFLFAFLSAFLFSNAQEKVIDLEMNPQLYHQHKQRIETAAGKKQATDALFHSPITLPLPFVDDFSRYHLKSFELGSFPVTDTVNRSVELTTDTLTFSYMFDTSWKYVYNIALLQIDSFPQSRIFLPLNNDQSYYSVTTEILAGWPLYYNNYTFDNLGNALDSAFVPADTTIEYSHFYGVQDSNARWLENLVYLNDNYATNKLSYGIATFDGLKANGLPHNGNSTSVYGSADSLTSQPINLNGLGINDSVFLSFSFEPKGIGDKPEAMDSLILEFKLLGSDWQEEWSTAGSDSALANPEFSNVLLHITNPFYFVSDFQFRFRNKATITGNNDHWHLDYVYLNKNRSVNETTVNDIAILSPAINFLKNYTSMPWNQFAADYQNEIKDSISVTFRNNYAFPQPMDFTYRAYEGFTNDPIFNDIVLSYNFPANSEFRRSYPVSDFIPYTPDATDSVSINVEVAIDENPTSVTRENDTVTTPVLFHNYFAYDDGTAERAYGLEGAGMKKFAYEFNLNEPDTLRALQFHFSQINEDLSLRELTLVVWKELGPGIAVEEDTLYYQDRTPFHYIDERNGFTIYVLDSPIVVENKFYIGWQQLFPENIQLGLDLNNSATSRMYYFSNGSWKQSLVEGAPMIRPIVGKNIPLIGTGMENPALSGEAFIYPNPSENVLYLKTTYLTQRIEIYDMQGKMVKSIPGAVEQIKINELNQGMYLLRIFSGKHAPQALRFIKL
ncbi:MAG: T9SS type A sorting domain-containing protein [Chitinophagales bacterium]|nr:T9SS type A sorting domain-containing protein [Chitinophagales bacterium]